MTIAVFENLIFCFGQGAESLASIRRSLGYFSGNYDQLWIGAPILPPDAPEPAYGGWRSKYGASLVGVTEGWVTNLNVLLDCSVLEDAKTIAKSVSGRFGGIKGVQTMALKVYREKNK